MRRKRARYKEALQRLKDYNPVPDPEVLSIKDYVMESELKRNRQMLKLGVKAFMFGLFVGAMIMFQIAPILKKMMEALLGI